jgi:acyl-coenzyme A synthetase/AMP-(fatty) acid ligase
MDGEALMDSESISEVKSALAAFPGLADVAVVEHGAGQAGECLIAYVVPSGPGLDVPELHAYARKTLRNGCLDVRISMADLFRAPTVADMDRRLGQMADTRK